MARSHPAAGPGHPQTHLGSPPWGADQMNSPGGLHVGRWPRAEHPLCEVAGGLEMWPGAHRSHCSAWLKSLNCFSLTALM